jgi:hypothetical protein
MLESYMTGNLKKSLLLTAFAALCFFVGSAEAKEKTEIVLPAGTLDIAQLEALFVSKTVVSQTVAKKRINTSYYEPGGTIRQVRYNGEYRKGSWRITKNARICLQFKDEREECRIVVRDGSSYEKYVVKKNNKHTHVINYLSFKAGNHLLQNSAKRKNIVKLPQGTLNAEEVWTLFSNRTVESVTATKKRKSLSYYDPVGTMRQVRNGQARHGSWRVLEHGRICLQMENLPEKCRIIVKEDGTYNKYIVKKNGQHIHSVSYPSFKKGNPYNL